MERPPVVVCHLTKEYLSLSLPLRHLYPHGGTFLRKSGFFSHSLIAWATSSWHIRGGFSPKKNLQKKETQGGPRGICLKTFVGHNRKTTKKSSQQVALVLHKEHHQLNPCRHYWCIEIMLRFIRIAFRLSVNSLY